MWREVLGLERIGVEENFFDVGGDSLLILRLHGRIEEALSPGLKAMALFRYPTIRSLARRLDASEAPSPGLDQARSMARMQRRTRSRRRRAPAGMGR